MNKKYNSNESNRNSGQLGALIGVAVLLILVTVGALAIDYAHIVYVRNALHKATDAAALAGAMHLSEDDLHKAESEALTIAEQHEVDGEPVSNSSNATSVNVNVELGDITNPSDPGRVRVTADRNVNHFWARIVGRGLDNIATRSVASGAPGLQMLPAGEAFPLAISIDAKPEKGFQGNNSDAKALSELGTGDMFAMDIGSQQSKNAAFTSFSQQPTNAPFIKQSIDEALGLITPPSPITPSVTVGEQINLNNGIIGQKTLADAAYVDALRAQPYLIMPVIEGSPPLVQSSPVIGFVAIKVTSVILGQGQGNDPNSPGPGIVERLEGEIVKPVVRGTPGNPPPGNTTYTTILQNISPWSVTLVE